RMHLDRREAGRDEKRRWDKMVDEWSVRYPALREEWDAAGEPGLAAARRLVPRFAIGEQLSPRNASSMIMAGIQHALPTMAGGAADLVDSTKTRFPSAGYFTAARADRNIAFGVREHAMAAA